MAILEKLAWAVATTAVALFIIYKWPWLRIKVIGS